MRYGYYMSVLSNAELAQIKADEDKVIEEEQAELARLKRIQDIALGIIDFKTDVIYTNDEKGSGKFYLNGIEYRLSSMSKYPFYWDIELQMEKRPNRHILNLFNKAYENGEFESIDYHFMTQAGYDIYLSGACS